MPTKKNALGLFIKYAFKEDYKLLIAINTIIFFSVIALCLVIRYSPHALNDIFGALFYSSFTFTFTAAIYGALISLIFLMIKNTVTKMFSRQGYLTFSLPVKNSTLIISRVLINLIYSLITFIILILSLVIGVSLLLNDLIAQLLSILNIDYIYSEVLFIKNILNDGISLILFSLVFLLSFSVINCSAKTSKGKWVVAVLLGFGILLAFSIVSTLLTNLSFGFAFDGAGKLCFKVGREIGFNYIFDFTNFLKEVAFIIGTYILCKMLLDKKLELC